MTQHTDERKTPRNLILATLAVVSLSAVACGGVQDGEEPIDGQDPAEAAEAQEYIEAVPTSEMLSIDDQGAEQLRVQALEGEEGSEQAASGRLRDHLADVRGGVQELVERTHANIDEIVTEGQLVATREGQRDCRMWTHDGVHMQRRLIICREDGQLEGVSGRAHGWILSGRALDAAEDAPYDHIAAGTGVRLEREDGKRGGAGRVGYDFDNLAKYTGESYGGKLGIGYRAAGEARQLVLGLKDLKTRQGGGPRTALYRYAHLIGRGGRFVLGTHHDFLTEADGGGLEAGTDGVEEYGRAVAAWRREGDARVTLAACGGTVGQGSCAFVRQCWATDGPVTFEQITAQESDLMWERSSCAAPALPASEPPAEAETSFEGATDAMAIPSEEDMLEMTGD